MAFKAVIFDLDGTLLDSLRDLADTLNTVLARHGYPTHELQQYRYLVGYGTRELVRRALPQDIPVADDKIETLCTKLLHTFPDCTAKTIEELRKPKLEAWNRNKENSRAWLALNMMTEARAGFRAFNEGTKDSGREVDFIALRRALAANEKWGEQLTENILPGATQRHALVRGLPWSEGAT